MGLMKSWRDSALLAGALLLALGFRARSEIAFDVHTIDNIGSDLGLTALEDIDGDGDLDWVAGEGYNVGKRMWWWSYNGPDDWTRHDVGQGYSDVGATAFDVDGDGDVDIVAGNVLFINNGKGSSWSRSTIPTIPTHDNAYGDINRDGKPDLTANWDGSGGGLYWYDPAANWAKHTISLEKHHGGAEPMPLGDFDGDGDVDIVSVFAWYENTDGGGNNWTKHGDLELGTEIHWGWGGTAYCTKSFVIDLDGDGDRDIVQSEADYYDGRVAWHENDGSANFTMHMIRERGEMQDFHSLWAADFDNDGDVDVFSGGGPMSGDHSLWCKGVNQKCYVWENTGGDGSDWVQHVIANEKSHEAEGGDVDCDGDVDICTKPYSTGNKHIFLRNLAVENGAEPIATECFEPRVAARHAASETPDRRFSVQMKEIFGQARLVVTGQTPEAYELTVSDVAGRVIYRRGVSGVLCHEVRIATAGAYVMTARTSGGIFVSKSVVLR